MQRILSSQALLLLLSAGPAAAEAGSTAPAAPMLIAWGVGGAVASIWAGRNLPWALAVTIAVPFLYFYTVFQQLQDPMVGQTILQDTGNASAAFYGSLLVFGFGATIGLKSALRRARG